jgi:hypothetical protein
MRAARGAPEGAATPVASGGGEAEPPTSQRARAVLVGVALAAGVASGILAKLADGAGSWGLGTMTSNIAVWVLIVGVWGATARTALDAVLRSAAFAAALTVSYYAWAELVLGYPRASITAMWIALSVTAVPVLAAVVQRAVRSARPLAGAALAIVASIPLTDEPVVHAWYQLTGQVSRSPQAPLAATVAVATWVTVLLILPRHRSTRLWGLAFAIPAYLVVEAGWRTWWSYLLGLT